MILVLYQSSLFIILTGMTYADQAKSVTRLVSSFSCLF